MKTSISDYENRILDILYADDITECLSDMLAIGVEVCDPSFPERERRELAERIGRGICFYGEESLNDELRHVAYLHLLVRLTHRSATYEELIRYIGTMQLETRYRFFLLTQAGHLAQKEPDIATTASRERFMAIYRQVVEGFGGETGVTLTRMKLSERLPHQAVILTRQYLNQTHMPTRLCDTIASIILRQLDQDVMIMNTNDLLPVGHVVPLFGIEGHNSMEYLKDVNYTFIDGVSVPYFQCENNMPDINAMKVILDTLRELRPQYVVSIGHFSPVASLAARMLPVIPADDLMPEAGEDAIRDSLIRHREMIAAGKYRKVMIRCI